MRIEDVTGRIWETTTDPLNRGDHGKKAGYPKTFFRSVDKFEAFSEWWVWEERSTHRLRAALRAGDVLALILSGRPVQRFIPKTIYAVTFEESFSVDSDLVIELAGQEPETLAEIYRAQVLAERQAQANTKAVLDQVRVNLERKES